MAKKSVRAYRYLRVLCAHAQNITTRILTPGTVSLRRMRPDRQPSNDSSPTKYICLPQDLSKNKQTVPGEEQSAPATDWRRFTHGEGAPLSTNGGGGAAPVWTHRLEEKSFTLPRTKSRPASPRSDIILTELPAVSVTKCRQN